MFAIQWDSSSVRELRLVTFLLDTELESKFDALVFKHLSLWDGDMSSSSAGATLVQSWIHHLRRNLFFDDFRQRLDPRTSDVEIHKIVDRISLDSVEETLAQNIDGICDIQSTRQLESCEKVMHSALRIAIEEMVRLQGSNLNNWTWGQIHAAQFSPLFESKSNALNKAFERTANHEGSSSTINVAAPRYKPSDGYVSNFGASFRQVMELGQSGIHYFQNSTGQSGNIVSRNYDDMLYANSEHQYYEFRNPDGSTEISSPCETTRLIR